MYSSRVTDSINAVLLDTVIDEGIRTGKLSNKVLANLLGVHRNTWGTWRKNWLKMPVEAMVVLCGVLELDIGDVLWFENKGSRQDVLTKREIEMIVRDNQSSRADICTYFNISEDYLRSIKSRGDIYLAEYCCIPPLVKKIF